MKLNNAHKKRSLDEIFDNINALGQTKNVNSGQHNCCFPVDV